MPFVIDFMELESLGVYPDGDFEIFFFDGDMFWDILLLYVETLMEICLQLILPDNK